ncbi:MAG TPA: hypothetical protein VMV59_01915 [Candidatus Dormibacteraeota bacterium]|nr:hypothetical protein [Candidatus Dormibacteraeota bacterium]
MIPTALAASPVVRVSWLINEGISDGLTPVNSYYKVAPEMSNDPAYQRRYRQDNAEKLKAWHRAHRTSRYGAPATAEEQKACLADPRKSLESKFGIVTAKFVFCMLCWHRYQELGHHLGHCKKRPAAWHGKRNLKDLYCDLPFVGLCHGTALACEALCTDRGETADKHGLGEYAKTDPNRKELLARIRPSNIGRKHSRQARLNKSDRQRGVANRARQTVPDETILRYWLVERLDLKAIARKTGKHASVIRARLERIFGTKVRRDGFFLDGQMVNGAWIKAMLLSPLQIKSPELESFVDAGVAWWLRSDRLERPLRTALAKSLIEARGWLTKRLIDGRSDYSKSALLATIVPNLSQQREEADIATRLLRDASAFERFTADISRDSSSLSHFRRVLGWVAEISRTLKSSRSAVDFLATKYGVTGEIIRGALVEKPERVPAEVMRAIIQPFLTEGRPVRGRLPGILSDTRAHIKLAARFSLQGFEKTEMAQYVFADKPGSAKSNIHRLFHDYGDLIEFEKLKMTSSQGRKTSRRNLRRDVQNQRNH